MDFQIKKFEELKVEELYEILRMRNEVFVIEQNCIYQDCDEKDKKAYHLLGIENEKMVAYLRILERGVSYNEISIGRVLVDQKHRGKGLARELLVKAIDFIEEHLNEKEIRISAQKYLLDFYKSLGFMIASEVYLEDGIPHVEMIYKAATC
ncbi:MAG: GNAT family N-acetyltransferase [Marinisporobacter sp.]|nr:GNAT family N-acetyltransferase [Marinisporobacter sp.]